MTESLVGIWIAGSDTRRSLEDTSALQRDFNGWLVERFAQNEFQKHQNEFQNHQNDVKVGLLLQRFCEFRGDLNQKRISEFFNFSTLVQTFSKFFKVAQGLRNAALLNCSFKIRTCQDRKLDSGQARSISSISWSGGGDFRFKITLKITPPRNRSAPISGHKILTVILF